MQPLFTVTGIVERGNGKGAELGFPTINIPCPAFVPSGIFAGEAIVDGEKYPAALYRHPKKQIIEAHILNFQDDLYGAHVTIIGYQKIRGHKRFHAEDELIKAIAQDLENVTQCIASFSHHETH